MKLQIVTFQFTRARMPSAFNRVTERLGCAVGILSMLTLFGCVTKVPGGDTYYRIKAHYSKELRRMDARYDYGRYKDQILGANSGISSFVDYHTLVVRWNGENAKRNEHQIAIGPLIDKLKEREKRWFPTGWAGLHFRYEEPVLRIDLGITSRSYPIQHYSYPLYQFEMR